MRERGRRRRRREAPFCSENSTRSRAGLSGRFKMAKRLRCEKYSRRLHVSEPEDKGRRGAAGEEDEEEKEERKARWKKRAHLNGKRGGVACLLARARG